MAIDFEKIKYLKNDEIEKGKKANTLTDLVSYINETAIDTKSYVVNLSVFKACTWVEWNDFWLKDKKYGERVINSYPRRKLVNVELGYGQIGSEAAFNHPAVVLYEEHDWILIAPITSKKYGKGLELLIDIPSGSCQGLTEPSTVQLDHIRAISKKRITGTRSGSLPISYMDKINESLLKRYAPNLYKEYVTLKEENNNLKEENNNLKKQNEKLIQELDVLKNRYKLLQLEINSSNDKNPKKTG